MSNEEINLRDELYKLFEMSALQATSVGFNSEEITLSLDFKLVEPTEGEPHTTDILNYVAEDGVMGIVEALVANMEPTDDIEEAEFTEVEEEQEES